MAKRKLTNGELMSLALKERKVYNIKTVIERKGGEKVYPIVGIITMFPADDNGLMSLHMFPGIEYKVYLKEDRIVE